MSSTYGVGDIVRAVSTVENVTIEGEVTKVYASGDLVLGDTYSVPPTSALWSLSLIRRAPVQEPKEFGAMITYRAAGGRRRAVRVSDDSRPWLVEGGFRFGWDTLASSDVEILPPQG